MRNPILRTCALGVVVCAVSGTASADIYPWSFDRPSQDFIDDNTIGPNRYVMPGMEVNDAAGIILSITTSFDSDTNQFTWSVAFDGQPDGSDFHQTNGFWLVLTPGGMPTGPGQSAILYFDGSGPDPVLNVFAYNALQSTPSFIDGSNDAGLQAPDPILSTLNDPGAATLDNTQNPDGTAEMSISMDASVIQSHVPFYGDPGDWTGVSYGPETIGVWFHTFTNLSTDYDLDGYLTDWSFARHGWLDAIDQEIPAPGALALLGLAGLAGRRRRRA